MHDIDLDGAEWNIFCDCVDNLRMGVKPDKFKKGGHITVHRTKNRRSTKNKWRGQCLGMEVKMSL